MKVTLHVEKDFPDHRGIPGHQGGSLPRNAGAGSTDSAPKERDFKDHKAVARDLAKALKGETLRNLMGDSNRIARVALPGGEASHKAALNYIRSLGFSEYRDAGKTAHFWEVSKGTTFQSSKFRLEVTRGEDMGGRKRTYVDVYPKNPTSKYQAGRDYSVYD